MPPPLPWQVNVNVLFPGVLIVTSSVPLKDFVPLHAPVAVQEDALVTLQLIVTVEPISTDKDVEFIVIIGKGGAVSAPPPPPPPPPPQEVNKRANNIENVYFLAILSNVPEKTALRKKN